MPRWRPRYLGLRAVVAKSFARIHGQNLINFGVLPLTFVDPADYVAIQAGDVLRLVGVRRALAEEHELVVENVDAPAKLPGGSFPVTPAGTVRAQRGIDQLDERAPRRLASSSMIGTATLPQSACRGAVMWAGVSRRSVLGPLHDGGCVWGSARSHAAMKKG